MSVISSVYGFRFPIRHAPATRNFFEKSKQYMPRALCLRHCVLNVADTPVWWVSEGGRVTRKRLGKARGGPEPEPDMSR